MQGGGARVRVSEGEREGAGAGAGEGEGACAGEGEGEGAGVGEGEGEGGVRVRVRVRVRARVRVRVAAGLPEPVLSPGLLSARGPYSCRPAGRPLKCPLSTRMFARFCFHACLCYLCSGLLLCVSRPC